MMNKMCGNCSGDHAYRDCPYIETDVTKQRMTELLQKEEMYDIIRKKTNDGPFSTMLIIDEALKVVKRLDKQLEEMKDIGTVDDITNSMGAYDKQEIFLKEVLKKIKLGEDYNEV